jgi:hypothetical protein
MTLTAKPPRWAEALLRASLKSDDFEIVSGDLLEHYRESVYPSRGRRGADLWYTMQVLGFVSQGAWLFAVLFSAQFLARTGLDWLMPTADFHTRATVSTFLGVGTLVAAGFRATWRSDSFTAGAIAGVATAGLAAILSVSGAATLLAIWHDPQTMAAIRGSGGLEEVFSLPIMMAVPGVLLGAAGGAAGTAAKRLLVT